MHSHYGTPVVIIVEGGLKDGDKASVLAMDIFDKLNNRTDLSYEQKEKALHLANEMLFQKLITDKDEPKLMTDNLLLS